MFLLGVGFQANTMDFCFGGSGIYETQQLIIENGKEMTDREDQFKKAFAFQWKNKKERLLRWKKMQEYKQAVLNQMLFKAVKDGDDGKVKYYVVLGAEINEEFNCYLKISDQFKKMPDYTDLIMRKYKKNVDQYLNDIVLPKHRILMRYYANDRMMKSKIDKKEYDNLCSQDELHVFFDTSKLSKEQIIELIKYVQLKANEYYVVYQKSAYSDKIVTNVFEKFSKELERLAQQIDVDLISFVPSYSEPESFAKKMVEKYQNFTEKELDEKRNFWNSDDWSSLLNNDKNCAWLIESIAKKVCENSKNNIVVCLGQSPSYWVMAAEIIDILKGNKDRKYWYIPFSGSFCDDLKEFVYFGYNQRHDFDFSFDFSVDLLYSSLYKKFLSESGFINKDDNLLVCEQLETGFGLKSFLEVMPFKKYSLFLNEYGGVYENIALNFFSELKEKVEYSFNTKQYFGRGLLNELMASHNETVRLVAYYPKSVWLFADPNAFRPGKEAEDRILRIIDYIHTSGAIKN